MDELLAGLNKAQRAAVTSDASILQVLAPPGSGKTKTLTARVAYLITRGLRPWNIIVCTFTVKAAKEMQERIKTIVGDEVKSKLKIGTFHGIALLYLRYYRQEARLRDNFGVADSSDSLAIVKRVVKFNESESDPKQVRNRISSLKSKGIDLDTFIGQNKSRKEQQEFVELYREYQAALEKGNLLDYDDILLCCVSLFRRCPECVSHVEAVLVDEFQDTNGVQYELMTLFAQRRQFITIVGDPDQSIYGWRSAEIKNLSRMKETWPDTVTINLEENYRSSGAILLAAQEIIEQDEHRPPKKLQATHSFGHRPVLRRLPTAWAEASWIVTEIKRLQALSGPLLAFNDFAILLRSASLSRVIEQTFGKEGIPYRMVGGLRFYDRKEVQIILDYLRVINATTHSEALERVVNVPSRKIGDASIAKLQGEAREKKMTLWEVIIAVTRGQKKVNIELPSQARQGLSRFIDVILTGQRKLEENTSLVDLMQYLIKKISLDTHLKDKYSEDHENRWANVEELIAQAVDVSNMPQPVLENDEEQSGTVTTSDEETPLCRFLANVSLAASANERSEEEVEKGGVVTISTIHAAKGLEWPVVFIPACFDGSIPHSRAEDHDEERRLLYVGMTRAQAMLYVSCPGQDSQKQETTLSTFLSQSGVKKFFDERGPSIRLTDVKILSAVLRRSEPSVADIGKSSVQLEKEEDEYWPTSGERPMGYSDEVEAWARSGEGMPVFGNSRSASWVNKNDGSGGSSFLLGFSSVSNQYEELMQKQERITQQRLDKKLDAAGKELAKPKGRKRQIEGQGTLSSFFGKRPKDDARPSLHPSTSDTVVLRDITNVSTEDNVPVVRSFDLPKMHRSIRSEPLRKRPGAFSAPRVRDTQAYVFLSSSPTKPEEDEKQQEDMPALQSLPPPQFKAASTLHTTSLGGLTATRKTLGVKRSLSGWNWSGRKH